MTALFEMRIRVGGDPRGFSEFMAVRDELAKLSHPACPDVDWAKVEQLCLNLFHQNGAELQTACAYVLARSHLHGVDGMAQGLALLEALTGEWSQLWPPMASAKLDILGWLFAQLQLLIRGREMNAWNLTALLQLETELQRLDLRLASQAQIPLLTLQALEQQVAGVVQRLERHGTVGNRVLQPVRMVEPAFVRPVVILPSPRMPEVKSRSSGYFWLAALLVMIALGGGFWANKWRASVERDGLLPDPVRLNSLSLFDAGSAELKPGSTKVLVSALVDIKAQPGWLIVIAGHTYTTGAVEQNLQLSHARASAVRDWMQRMGDIADSCFAVQGFAASQPVASNDTEAGRAANRRVDIRLMPQTGACAQAAAGSET